MLQSVYGKNNTGENNPVYRNYFTQYISAVQSLAHGKQQHLAVSK